MGNGVWQPQHPQRLPAAPTAVAGNGTLDWSWACPKDNGAAVTEFDFQWREQGTTTWNTVAALTAARYLLTALTNGTTYEAQVQATNSQGDSGYGAVGMSTPVAAVPGGGSTLALRANPGSPREVDLDWLAPANNGAVITGYTYQWRTSGQAYSTGRQGTTATLTATVSNLANGTQYFFQVYATNSEGNGPVSNESDATPEASIPPPPVSTVPGAPTSLTGTPRRPLTIDWVWELPNSNGGERISSYDHQWRYDGDAWSGNLTTGLERSYMSITVANANNAVDARVRARNSVGTSGWSGTTQVSASDIADQAGTITQRHRFTSSQTWNVAL